MFYGYTTAQLLHLRALCYELLEQTEDVIKTADLLLLLEHIETELSMTNQQFKESA